MEPLKLDKKKCHPIFILHPAYVETILDENNQSLIEYTKPLVCRFFQIHVNHQRCVTTPQKKQGKIVKIYTFREVVIFNTVPSKMTFECDNFFGVLSEYLTRLYVTFFISPCGKALF